MSGQWFYRYYKTLSHGFDNQFNRFNITTVDEELISFPLAKISIYFTKSWFEWEKEQIEKQSGQRLKLHTEENTKGKVHNVNQITEYFK